MRAAEKWGGNYPQWVILGFKKLKNHYGISIRTTCLQKSYDCKPMLITIINIGELIFG